MDVIKIFSKITATLANAQFFWGGLRRCVENMREQQRWAVCAANRNFHLAMKASVISWKQCPNRVPATIETDTPPVKRRGSSFLKPDSSKIAANSQYNSIT